MKKIALGLFIASASGELVSTVIDAPTLHLICKPALLITLLFYYIAVQRESGKRLSRGIVLALVFSWGGDVLLMNTGEIYFILGLLAFLVAHVFYIFTFRQFRDEDTTQALRGLHRIRFAFPIILFGTGLIVVLYPNLGDMLMPVMVYALVLTLMVLNALFRFKRTSAASFALVFGGAILFMISDSLLAVNKFLEPVSYSGFWIMSTYIGAQFLIVHGLSSINTKATY